MHDQSIGVRPDIDEFDDRTCVVCREKNVRLLVALVEVVKMEPQYRGKPWRDVGGLSLRIGYRDAYLVRAGLIALGIFSREHDEVGGFGRDPLGDP
jgi:hypothetical protein